MNDLTNRELIRQKYTFKPPARKDLFEKDEFAEAEDEEIFLGSMIMQPKQKRQNVKPQEPQMSKDVTAAQLTIKQMFDQLNEEEDISGDSASLNGAAHNDRREEKEPGLTSAHLFSMEKLQDSILLPTIQANDWQRELARVTKLLKPPTVAHVDDELDDYHER